MQLDGVNFYVSCSDGNCYSYQWKLNENDIPGATSWYYTATAAGKYKCVISNKAGSVNSNSITVTANPLPATIQAYPSAKVCGGIVSLSNTGQRTTINGN